MDYFMNIKNSGQVRAGVIEMPSKMLLDFLQYPNGKITHIQLSPDKPDVVELVLQDDEMPMVSQGELYTVVTPSYTTYTDCLGHSMTIREQEVSNK